MSQVGSLRAISPEEAISAIVRDLESGGSTYASVGAIELIKACGVEVARGSLSIDWMDMPLDEAEDLANFVHQLESKVAIDRRTELQGLLAKHEEGALVLTKKDFQGDEWELMEAAYNQKMQPCI